MYRSCNRTQTYTKVDKSYTIYLINYMCTVHQTDFTHKLTYKMNILHFKKTFIYKYTAITCECTSLEVQDLRSYDFIIIRYNIADTN